ncbi:MAG: hypothetical protein IJ055_02605 [Oscillospiraceae bacterium]|nr:hypothetical protein [Oscillospiraceae bacterium]
MNRMHSSQLTSLLLLSGIWQVICLPAARGAGQLSGTAGACLLELVLTLPMLVLAKNGITLYTLRHPLPSALSILFFLLWGALGMTELWEVMPHQLLPVSGRMTAAVLIVLTCLYTGIAGLRSAARAAPLLLGLLLVSLGVLVLGAWRRVDPGRLTGAGRGIGQGFFHYLTACGELGAAWVLLGEVRHGGGRAVLRALLGKALFCMGVLFLSLTVCGRLSTMTGYPWFTLTALSQPLQGQRADALYTLLFVMLCVMHITLQTILAASLVQRRHPSLPGAPVLSLGAMLLAAWLIPQGVLRLAGSVLCFVTAVLLPLWLLIRKRRRVHLAALLLCPLLLTGCASQSVADRTYTQVLSLSQDSVLTLTVQPFGEEARAPVQGRSLEEVLGEAQLQAGGRVFIGHTELLCLDGTCTADTAQALLFGQGLSPACKVLYLPAPQEGLPAGEPTVHTLRMAEETGLLCRTELATVLEEWAGAGQALVPTLTPEGVGLVLLGTDGTCTPLSPAAARGMYWLRHASGGITLPLETAQGPAAVQIGRIRRFRTVQPEGTLLYTVSVHAPQATAAQRRILQRRIRAECLAALKEMTAVHADVTGMLYAMDGVYPARVRVMAQVEK